MSIICFGLTFAYVKSKYCLIKKIIMNLIQKQNTFIPFLFDDFINREFNLDKSIFETYPAVNIKELDSLFQIELAVPGKNKNDFQIEIEGGLLTISSNVEEKNNSDNFKFTKREFSYNNFKRTFTLPESIDETKIDAKYFEGVLKISLPKQKESMAQPKKIIKIK